MDILSELSVRIYEEPLASWRESGKISDLSEPLSILILIIDFETEISMNGILNFFGNSTGMYAYETADALRKIGCDEEAAYLDKMISIALKAGMTHEEIQKDRSKLDEFAITSFKKLHGDKWDDAADAIREIEDNIDYSKIYDTLDIFVDQNREYFEQCLKKA